MLGRRYGFITPPEQYRTIFDSYFLGILIIVVSFLYSCFYVSVQLIGSGLLFTVVTGGFFPFFVGSVALATTLEPAGSEPSRGWTCSSISSRSGASR